MFWNVLLLLSVYVLTHFAFVNGDVQGMLLGLLFYFGFRDTLFVSSGEIFSVVEGDSCFRKVLFK